MVATLLLDVTCSLGASVTACAELQKILFQSHENDLSLKTDDLKKLKWAGKDGEKIANHIEEKISRASETRLLQMEKEWMDKVNCHGEIRSISPL